MGGLLLLKRITQIELFMRRGCRVSTLSMRMCLFSLRLWAVAALRIFQRVRAVLINADTSKKLAIPSGVCTPHRCPSLQRQVVV